jgi:D-lyxose ketol-isomerase
MEDLTRRTLIGGAALAGLAAAGCQSTGPKAVAARPNADFYGPDRTFNAEAAKQAYFDMMKAYNYPIPPKLQSPDMWVQDFGLGRFTEVGMAGIFWINEKEADYFGHEIYLLPGQMIPEHWHVKTADARPKMEGWHLRHGSVTLFGEGDPTPGAEATIPASERAFAKCRHATPLAVGELGKLNRPEAPHFMVAGPQGCIVTEYASYHDGKARRFTTPDVKL